MTIGPAEPATPAPAPVVPPAAVPAAVPAPPVAVPTAAPAAPSRKARVRVTMFADPIEVDVDEIPVLRSQGLLIEDPSSPEGTTP